MLGQQKKPLELVVESDPEPVRVVEGSAEEDAAHGKDAEASDGSESVDVFERFDDEKPKPKPRRRCYLSQGPRSCLWCLGFACFGMAFYLMTQASTAVDLAARSTQCSCLINDFQAAQILPEPGEEAVTCETMDGFFVAVRCESYKGGLVYVQNWMPEYIESYHSATGFVAKHAAFSCCPKSLDDLCAFQEGDYSLFCDDWGKIRSDCPSAPWACYVVDMEEKLLLGDLKPPDLMVGDTGGGAALVMGAFILVVAGALLVLFLLKRFWMASLKRVLYRYLPGVMDAKIELTPGSRVGEAAFQIALAIPRRFRTRSLQDLVDVHAACRIQRVFRGFISRKRFTELIDRLVKDGDARAIMLRQKDTHMMKTDPAKMTRRLAARFERGDRLRMPPGSGPAPVRGLLYDTGSPQTFRRMVCARVASEPGEPSERIEVALNDRVAGFLECLRVVGDGRGGKVVVQETPPQHISEDYGLARGQRLMRVGDLTWPATTGYDLLWALHAAPRPVFLVFEGPARNPDPPNAQVPTRRAPTVRSPSGRSPHSRSRSPAHSFSSTWSPTSPVSDAESTRLLLPGAVPTFSPPRSPRENWYGGSPPFGPAPLLPGNRARSNSVPSAVQRSGSRRGSAARRNRSLSTGGPAQPGNASADGGAEEESLPHLASPSDRPLQPVVNK